MPRADEPPAPAAPDALELSPAGSSAHVLTLAGLIERQDWRQHIGPTGARLPVLVESWAEPWAVRLAERTATWTKLAALNLLARARRLDPVARQLLARGTDAALERFARRQTL